MSLQVTLDFSSRGPRCSGLFNMFKVTNSESYVMTIIIDHKKQRCHDDGAVYFMHSTMYIIVCNYDRYRSVCRSP